MNALAHFCDDLDNTPASAAGRADEVTIANETNPEGEGSDPVQRVDKDDLHHGDV